MIKKSLIELFKEIYGSSPDVFSSAPGRINIIGEHTDYNLGYVLPAAIDSRVYFLAKKRNDDDVHLWAQNFEERICFSIKELTKSNIKRWSNYIKGVLWVLEEEGFRLQGINGLIWGDIPLETGLSSSAALEVSVVNGFDKLFGLNLKRKSKVFLAQKAENDFVGVKCGIMDQFISIYGEKNAAFFLDCENYSYEQIPFNIRDAGLSILVYDTQIKRELAASEYNVRRKEALEAFCFLKKKGFKNFKEVNSNELEKAKGEMSELIYKRANHIISENTRVVESVRALKEDNFEYLGKLLFNSHKSLRDNYEVSCPELNLLYKSGKEFAGCLGARLTGAGFGGSGIALVKRDSISSFRELLHKRVKEKGFKKPKIYEIEVDEGARVYSLTKEKKG